MRVFEGTASGALMLTDSAANGLPELFAAGKELVLFSDDEDLFSKIDYYLAHESERAAIADAGRRRTRSEHTYAHRAQAVLDTVLDPSLQKLSPMRNAEQAACDAESRAPVSTELHCSTRSFISRGRVGDGPVRRMRYSAPCLLRRLMR